VPWVQGITLGTCAVVQLVQLVRVVAVLHITSVTVVLRALRARPGVRCLGGVLRAEAAAVKTVAARATTIRVVVVGASDARGLPATFGRHRLALDLRPAVNPPSTTSPANDTSLSWVVGTGRQFTVGNLDSLLCFNHSLSTYPARLAVHLRRLLSGIFSTGTWPACAPQSHRSTTVYVRERRHSRHLTTPGAQGLRSPMVPDPT
jgi:hypothetical protein